jgi:DNA-directed RNA polymerase sigma subunit (sigma70/sigma32)
MQKKNSQSGSAGQPKANVFSPAVERWLASAERKPVRRVKPSAMAKREEVAAWLTLRSAELSEREQTALRLRFGIGVKVVPNYEIGWQLKIPAEQVRRILADVIWRMRNTQQKAGD